MRISWNYTPLHDKFNLNCFIGGKNRQESYMFHVGESNKGGSARLTKGNKTLSTSVLATQPQKAQPYHFQMVKTDSFVSLSIDGLEIITYIDPDIRIGSKHQYFGFDLMFETTIGTTVSFSNLLNKGMN